MGAEKHIKVGHRVQTDDTPPRTGTVIEDFGELAGQPVVLDATKTVCARRWGIALDDGDLVFRDSHSLRVIG